MAGPPERPRSPFFKPSTPRSLVEVQSPGGTKTLKKKAKPSSEAKSGIGGTVANLVTCIVGSGIVGVPFALREAGLVAGSCMVVLCALLTDKSLRMLIDTAKYADVPSYETLMEGEFGLFVMLWLPVYSICECKCECECECKCEPLLTHMTYPLSHCKSRLWSIRIHLY